MQKDLKAQHIGLTKPNGSKETIMGHKTSDLRGRLKDKMNGEGKNEDHETMKEVIEELKGAVIAHRSQHERLSAILKRMEKGK